MSDTHGYIDVSIRRFSVQTFQFAEMI